MKMLELLSAAACVLLLAGNGTAHETGKPHKHKHRAPKAQAAKPVQPKDPYAKYWNDPGRSFPPYSYTRDAR